ncbi:hypothetical protein CRUP_023666, partial [Coryphaenoides rupestris]
MNIVLSVHQTPPAVLPSGLLALCSPALGPKGTLRVFCLRVACVAESTPVSGRVRSSVYKLDGGEASGGEGPAFVLRHRTSNLAERTTNGAHTDPVSLRAAEDTPTSGSSTNHLSATECPHVLNG